VVSQNDGAQTASFAQLCTYVISCMLNDYVSAIVSVKRCLWAKRRELWITLKFALFVLDLLIR